MQQVWRYLEKLMGKDLVKILCLLFSLAIAGLWIGYLIGKRRGFLRPFAACLILFVGFIFALSQPVIVEKMHVLEYGFLGWLALRDFNKAKPSFKSFLCTLLFVVIISALDEFFQKLLPYRYGQISDMNLNIISGLFGIVLFAAK